jgi:hypothetical protein
MFKEEKPMPVKSHGGKVKQKEAFMVLSKK